MTTTYDPFHPKYFVDNDVREELTRAYDLYGIEEEPVAVRLRRRLRTSTDAAREARR